MNSVEGVAIASRGGAPSILRNITKAFGETIALSDVSLDLRAGEVHALLGENGAGKTTLMKILYGLSQPDSGQIEADGVVLKLNLRVTRALRVSVWSRSTFHWSKI